MRLGVNFPNFGTDVPPKEAKAIVRRIEQAGLDTLWFSDHVIIPLQRGSPYLTNRTGVSPLQESYWYESVSMMAFFAGATDRLRMAVSVIVLPQRNPVLLAKQLATIDNISGGRLTVGVGIGWMREEFQALAAPFEHRGARSDEYLQLMKALWTQDAPSFNGKYYTLATVNFLPKPAQKPHPPILIGGHSEAAKRRVMKHGDGWVTSGLSPEAMRPQIEEMKRLAKEHQRDFKTVTLCAKNIVSVLKPGEPHPGNPPGEDWRLAGTPSQIKDTLRQFQDMGVQEVGFRFRIKTWQEYQREVDRFLEAVPAIKL